MKSTTVEGDLSQRTCVCCVVLTLIDPSVLFTMGSKGMYSVCVTCTITKRLGGERDERRREDDWKKRKREF